MKSILALLLLVYSAGAVTLNEVKAKLNEQAGSIKTMRFDLDMSVDAMGQKINQHMNYIIKMPDKMKLTSTGAFAQETICDGKEFVTRIPSMNQEVREKITDENPADQMLGLVGNGSQYFEDNDCRIVKTLADGKLLIEAIPLKPSDDSGLGEIGRTELVVDYANGVIPKITMFDTEGNVVSTIMIAYRVLQGIRVPERVEISAAVDNAATTTSMVFSNIFLNENLPDQMFTVK